MALYVNADYSDLDYTADSVLIDWPNKIIHVPKTFTVLNQSVPTEIRNLDIDTFRRKLKSLEDDPEGMPSVDTHKHNTIVTLGGVTYARLIEIINGYTVTFEDGKYAVNLAGANSNIGDVINVNQVSVRSANSAGLTYSKEIEDQSFLDGRIWIETDPNHGHDDTQFPAGTHGRPVLSYDLAEVIGKARDLPHRFSLSGTQVLSSFDEGDRSNWLGTSPVNATLVLAGCDTTGFIIRRCTITGTGLGNFSLQDGVIADLVDFEGDCSNSGLGGTITFPSGPMTEMITFHNCFSIVPGTGSPTLDCNNATNILVQFRSYAGGIEIRNYSGADNAMTIDLQSGHVKLDASCTDGTIVVRGDGHITDNSNGTTVVRKGLSLNETDGVLLEKRWIALA